MDDSWPVNPFWDFSLRLYARPGVAPACLALQARHNLDVNVVLYCAWLGLDRGIALDDALAARIVRKVAAWHDAVVRGLRAVRVDLKSDRHRAPEALSESLRAAIKRIELDAERIEQQMLAALDTSDARRATPSATVARENIHAYLRSVGITPVSADVMLIDALLGEVKT